MSERDLAVMYHIIDKIPFDFLKLFVTYVGEAINQSKMNMPYGMTFTKIFRECGVRILNNEPKDVLRNIDLYTIRTLSRMSFKKKEEKWMRKIGPDPPTSPIPPHSTLRVSTSPLPSNDTQLPIIEPEASSPHPPSSAHISFEQVKDLVSSLSNSFTSQFQTLQKQNTKLRNEKTNLKAQNSELRENLQS